MPTWRVPLLALCAGILLLILLPLWTVPVLPASGWTSALHEARLLADVLRHGPDAYHARLWVPTPMTAVPYLLALTGPSHLEMALRLLASLALLSTVLVWWLWLRNTKRSPWLLVGALPWLVSQPFLQGDIAILLSWPLWFGTLALQIPAMRRTWLWPLVALLVTLVALTHPLPWLSLLVLLPLLALLQAGRHGWKNALKWTLFSLLSSLPSVLLLRPWWLKVLTSMNGWPGMVQAWRQEWWLPGDNFRQLVDLSLDRLNPHAAQIPEMKQLFDHHGELVAFAWTTALIVWLAASVRQGRENPQNTVKNPQPIHALVLLSLAYFLLPARIHSPLALPVVGGQLPPLLAILAVLALPLDPLQPPLTFRVRTWLATLTLVVVAVALPLLAWQSLLLDATSFGSLHQAFATIPEGQRVCTLSARSDVRHVRAGVFDDLGGWSLILRGGLSNEPAPNPGLSPLTEEPLGHLPWLPRANDARLKDMAPCQYIAVFRDPGVALTEITKQFRALPQLYAHDAWEVFQNVRAGPWPPPQPLTPDEERLNACFFTMFGLPPEDMPDEQPQALSARLGLDWGPNCLPFTPPARVPGFPPPVAVPYGPVIRR